ncbi:MAG: hypothetical protein GY761_13195 [Hyphomicrobiales bacterium]|nr:hypothetical protein [Hyphomicrobiales bacterium]
MSDPVGALVGAELSFTNYQISSGMDLLRQGLEPQTSAELQNLQLAKETQNLNPVVDQQTSPVLQPQPQFQQFNSNRMQPLNPMSTVPGGMGFQSTMPKPSGG